MAHTDLLLSSALGAYSPGVTLTPARQVPDFKEINPPGRRVSAVQDALAATLRRADDPDAQVPVLQGVPNGTSWSTPGRKEEVMSRSAPLLAKFQALGAAGDPLALAEADNLSKLTVQSGAYPGWHVKEHGYNCLFEAEFDEQMTAVINALPEPEPYQLRGARRHTNHGSPSFRSDDLDMVGHALLAYVSDSFEHYTDLHNQIAASLGGVQEPVVTLLSRTGPISKLSPVYGWVGDKRCKLGEAVGYAPRRREVLGVPMTAFFWLRPFYAHMMGSLLQLHSFAAGKSLAAIESVVGRALAGGAKGVNDDISGYDQSVSRRLQEATGRAIVARWPRMAAYVAFWLEVEQLRVAAPKLHLEDSAFLYEAVGSTTSGVIVTAVMGTIFNYGRSALCARRSGLCPDDPASGANWALHSGELVLLGDDTLILSTSDFDHEAWAAASATWNFRCKIQPGAVFLRRFFTPSGSFGLASRLIQQTAFNEHAPQSLLMERLGLAVRTAGTKGNPFIADAWAVLQQKDTPADGLSPEEVTSWLASPAFQAAVTEEAARGQNPFLLAREAQDEMSAGPAATKIAFLERLLGRAIVERWSEDVVPSALTKTDAWELARAILAYAGPKDMPITARKRAQTLLKSGLR